MCSITEPEGMDIPPLSYLVLGLKYLQLFGFKQFVLFSFKILNTGRKPKKPA